MPMIAMTTSSSTSVKPRDDQRRRPIRETSAAWVSLFLDIKINFIVTGLHLNQQGGCGCHCVVRRNCRGPRRLVAYRHVRKSGPVPSDRCALSRFVAVGVFERVVSLLVGFATGERRQM